MSPAGSSTQSVGKISAGAIFSPEWLQSRMLGRAERAMSSHRRTWTRHAEPEELRAQLSAIEVPLGEAEALNALNLKRRPFARRIMRQQGRINRLAQQASEIAANTLLVHAHETPAALELVQQALNHLSLARHAQHSGWGSGIFKRLTRKQGPYNDEMAEAMILLNQAIRALPVDLEDYPDVAEALEHLQWHAGEARHVQGLCASLPAWRQRIKRNQYEINRCLVICITQLLFILQSLQD